MTDGFNISHLNTKRIGNNAIIYNFRNLIGVKSFIDGISCSFKGIKPIAIIRYGISDSKDSLVDSIAYLTDLYSKRSGILLRGQFVSILKDYIYRGQDYYQAVSLANEYAKYILYRGFHLQINIYDMGEEYLFLYLINPINYIDGSKYISNDNEILQDEEDCFDRCLQYINGSSDEYDFSSFEAYPLPY